MRQNENSTIRDTLTFDEIEDNFTWHFTDMPRKIGWGGIWKSKVR